VNYETSSSSGIRLAFLGENETRTKSEAWPYVVLGTAATIFFYPHLFHLPFVPIEHGGDQYIYLEHAERMLRGSVIYRDLFQFNLPGTEYLYLAFMKVLGLKLWIGALALLCAFVAITLLTFSLSRLVLTGAAALLPSIAYMVACQRSSIDGSHHWYSTLLVLIAVTLHARARSTVWIGCAGLLLGVATLFTSTRGIAVALGVSLFYFWSIRDKRAAMIAVFNLFAPLILFVAVCVAYLAVQSGPRIFFESVLVFPARYYSAGYANDAAIFLEAWQRLVPLSLNSILALGVWFGVSFAVPLVFIIFAVRHFRLNSSRYLESYRNRRIALYAFAGFFALLPALGAPSAPRFNCAAAFAYIVCVAMIQTRLKPNLLSGALAAFCVIAIAEFAIAVGRPTFVVDGPRGLFAVFNQSDRDYMESVIDVAKPGDQLFGDPATNFLLGLPNPSKLAWIEPDEYTRPEQVVQLVADMAQQHTRMVLWSEDLNQYSGVGDNLQPLRDFLKSRYHPGKRFDDGSEILVLNEVWLPAN
jgi:hypothetical protein